MTKVDLKILTDSAEIRAALTKLSERQLQKYNSHRDSMLAARPDGTVIVYRPTQK